MESGKEKIIGTPSLLLNMELRKYGVTNFGEFSEPSLRGRKDLWEGQDLNWENFVTAVIHTRLIEAEIEVEAANAQNI